MDNARKILFVRHSACNHSKTGENRWITRPQTTCAQLKNGCFFVDNSLKSTKSFLKNGKKRTILIKVCNFVHKRTFFSTEVKSYPHSGKFIRRGINVYLAKRKSRGTRLDLSLRLKFQWIIQLKMTCMGLLLYSQRTIKHSLKKAFKPSAGMSATTAITPQAIKSP